MIVSIQNSKSGFMKVDYFIVHLHGKCDSPSRRLLNFLQPFFRSGTNLLAPTSPEYVHKLLYNITKLIKRVCVCSPRCVPTVS